MISSDTSPPSPSPSPSTITDTATEAETTATTPLPISSAIPCPATQTRDGFLAEAEALLLDPIGHDNLLRFSAALKTQFYDRMADGDSPCMLPSYNHLLPTGAEKGRVVSIDLGGTTLRIALVELAGRIDGAPQIRVVDRTSWTIKTKVKRLVGIAFFHWLAERIIDAVAGGETSMRQETSGSIPLALAWSFPIIQTSLATGLIQPMGKGFRASDGMVGRDLAAVIQTTCATRGLDVKIKAILNDSGATLFSQAYKHANTRMGLIIGTGVNVSCLVPIPCLARPKFGSRCQAWFDAANHVVVNVELGLFGGDGIIPFTRWDAALRDRHPRPDFQPLEYFTSGQYLGEICRFGLLEAIETAGALGGVVPDALQDPYSLDSETLSIFKGDASCDLEQAQTHFISLYPSEPTPEDLLLIRKLAELVTLRSAALVATAIFTLWELQLECDAELDQHQQDRHGGNSKSSAADAASARSNHALANTVVACNGAVIEKYPHYKDECQRHLDELVRGRGHDGAESIQLVNAVESSLLGAAVAASCLEEELGLLS